MSIKYWAAATVLRYKNCEREILILWLSHWFHDVWQFWTNRGTRNQLGPHFPSFPADLIKALGRVTTDSRRQIARLITAALQLDGLKRHLICSYSCSGYMTYSIIANILKINNSNHFCQIRILQKMLGMHTYILGTPTGYTNTLHNLNFLASMK